MKTNTIKEIIKKSIPDSQIEVIDTNNTGDHFSVLIVSDQFMNLGLLDRHKLIYKILDKYITKEIHALQLKTLTFKEHKS